jgi:hypothetical protein
MNQLLHGLINKIYLEKWVLQQVRYNYDDSSWYVRLTMTFDEKDSDEY